MTRPQLVEAHGLLINANISPEMGPMLQMTLGFEDLSLLNAMSAYGSSAGTMVQYASMAIQEGLANVVVLVYADAPLVLARSSSQAYSGSSTLRTGMSTLSSAYGYYGANPGYALAARRHMHLFGTTSEQLGAIAVAQRKWAQMNPWAQMRKPMTLEDHQNSRFVVEPLHLLDCSLVSNGAVAVIITSAERASSLKQPPVYVLGLGQGATGDNQRSDAAAILICEANRGSESFGCTFSANSNSDPDFLANICYTLPSYASQVCFSPQNTASRSRLVSLGWKVEH